MAYQSTSRMIFIRAAMLATLFAGAACDTAAFAQATPEMRAPPVKAPGSTCPVWDGNSAQAGPDDRVMPVPTLEELKAQMLRMHNDARAAVHVEPLTWDDGLAAKSLEYAQWLINNNNSALTHSTDRVGIGENLSGGNSTALGNRFGAVRLANLWVREGNWYDAKADSYKCDSNATVNHYTQMVWRNTRKVGCGYAAIGYSRVLACRYSPGGNVSGEPPFPPGEASSWQNLDAVQFPVGDPALGCHAQVNKDDVVPAMVEALNCARKMAGIATKLTLDPALAQQAQASAVARDALETAKPGGMWNYPAAAGATEYAANSYNLPVARNAAALVYEVAVTNPTGPFKAPATDAAKTRVGCGWFAGPGVLNGANWQRLIVVCRFG